MKIMSKTWKKDTDDLFDFDTEEVETKKMTLSKFNPQFYLVYTEEKLKLIDSPKELLEKYKDFQKKKKNSEILLNNDNNTSNNNSNEGININNVNNNINNNNNNNKSNKNISKRKISSKKKHLWPKVTNPYWPFSLKRNEPKLSVQNRLSSAKPSGKYHNFSTIRWLNQKYTDSVKQKSIFSLLPNKGKVIVPEEESEKSKRHRKIVEYLQSFRAPKAREKNVEINPKYFYNKQTEEYTQNEKNLTYLKDYSNIDYSDINELSNQFPYENKTLSNNKFASYNKVDIINGSAFKTSFGSTNDSLLPLDKIAMNDMNN